MSELISHPILSPQESICLENEFFRNDEGLQWEVINRAGNALADAALRDMRELRTIPHQPRLLVLAGKGHNGADALLAARRFLRTIPTARAVVWPWASKEDCRPMTQRAFEEVIEFASKRLEVLPAVDGMKIEEMRETFSLAFGERGFDLTLDGLLGMQGRPGFDSPVSEWIELINASDAISFRAAVDIPTGLPVQVSQMRGEGPTLRADFTYCTGIVKEPVILDAHSELVGRLRYLDLGFFNGFDQSKFAGKERVLCPSSLRKLRKLRPVACDKRDFGHLLAVVGSRDLGGAALLCARAALRAGVGLLTCCVPQSLHPAMAASCPEAMWVPMPETPEGGIALEGLGIIRKFLDRADAWVTGPGIGPEPETHSLIREVVKLFDGPTLLDADALRPEIVHALKNPKECVLTPHSGELARLGADDGINSFIDSFAGVIVRKGPHTSVMTDGSQTHLLGGTSLMARGGTGDLLSGIVASLLARGNHSPFDCASLGALWHGRAAEALARQHGQEAVCSSQILDNLSFALRNDF